MPRGPRPSTGEQALAWRCGRTWRQGGTAMVVPPCPLACLCLFGSFELVVDILTVGVLVPAGAVGLVRGVFPVGAALGGACCLHLVGGGRGLGRRRGVTCGGGRDTCCRADQAGDDRADGDEPLDDHSLFTSLHVVRSQRAGTPVRR